MNMIGLCVFIGVILTVGGAVTFTTHLVTLLDQECQGTKRSKAEDSLVVSAAVASFGLIFFLIFFITSCLVIIAKVLSNV